MRSIKFYISMVIAIGLFIGVNSTSFAEERYDINVDSIKKEIKQSMWGGAKVIEWKAKVRNNSDKSQTYEVKINFLNNNNVNIKEAAKIVTVNPNETKGLNYDMKFDSSTAMEIESGYITIAKVDEIADKAQTLTARLDKNMDLSMVSISDSSVELAYSVKLRNNTDRTMTRNVTVSFLDADNNHVRSETRKATFAAGELKLISDRLVVRASEAEKIATGHVTIN